MSSYQSPSQTTTAPSCQRLMYLLKTKGPQCAMNLSQELGVTGEAVRQQLMKMEKEGWVIACRDTKGQVGRPKQLWALTPAAHQMYPNAHAELSAQLIRTIRDTLGEAALEQLIKAREEETTAAYENALADASTLGERVARLTQMRQREGYMAEWQEHTDHFLLLENHCPICVAAAACQGFCRSELATFQKVLGTKIKVERTEHILSHGRRCVYRIHK